MLIGSGFPDLGPQDFGTMQRRPREGHVRFGAEMQHDDGVFPAGPIGVCILASAGSIAAWTAPHRCATLACGTSAPIQT